MSRSAPRENGSIRCFLSPCRRKMLATTTSSGMARCGCSSSGREPLSRISRPIRSDAAAIAAICRRLDGIPLAIELAAARTAALSVEQLVAHLHDRFHLLTGGRRTALPRHQTLRATLDWSYELLPEPERVILRRLAIFSGVFSLEAAGAVAASPEIPPAQVIQGLSDLVAKSLVVDRDGSCRALPPARYDAGLRARKTCRKRRKRAAGASTRRVLPRPLRTGRSRVGYQTNSGMAGRLRAKNRQFARSARLGLLARSAIRRSAPR